MFMYQRQYFGALMTEADYVTFKINTVMTKSGRYMIRINRKQKLTGRNPYELWKKYSKHLRIDRIILKHKFDKYTKSVREKVGFGDVIIGMMGDMIISRHNPIVPLVEHTTKIPYEEPVTLDVEDSYEPCVHQHLPHAH